MDSIKQIMKQNGIIIKVAIALLMFVLAGFCPLVDVMGKATVNGFKVLFDGEGMGFSRFMTFFVICAPIATCFFAAFKGIEDRLTLFGFGICFVSVVIFWLVLPELCSLATGGILYLILAIVALVLNYIEVKDDAEAQKRKTGLF